ncbi:MAG TPA: hypothetical protein EYG04_06305 [Candidatus Poseidoniales archaeon]|nr:hypothetical protein [Candidatus Poseidoniales archaeon]
MQPQPSSMDCANSIEMDPLITNLHLCVPTTDSAPMMRFGKYDDLPHQHLALARLSSSDWKGILIADEVGLGKTISAINILCSLRARGKNGGVIVICPGGLKRKWKNEFWHRADLDVVETKTGADFRHSVERINSGEPLVVIVSHGVLRRAEILDWLIQNTPQIMLTIVDEAHHIRNPKSRLHDAVTMFSLQSEKVVLLTATPVNLSTDDLHVQLSQLSPDRWPDGRAFYRSLRPGNILNDMLDCLAKPEPEIMELEHNLCRLENIVGYYGDSRLEMLSQLIRAGNWLEETKSLRTASADLVRKLRPLNGLVVRSRRRDMDWDLPKRKAVTLDLQLTKKEWHLYLAAKNWSLRLIELRNPDNEHYDWALLIPERMASSCLPAFSEHVLRKMQQTARFVLNPEEFEEGEEEIELNEEEHLLLSRIGDPEVLIRAAAELGETDSKSNALLNWIIPSLQNDPVGGVIIFSHFRGTLAYLQRRMDAAGLIAATITGSTPMALREDIRNRFSRGEIEVLLSSEVGSEGLDQQHCHRIVNYDLPWNPMKLEQRIGRIDRFGQKADHIEVLNIAVEGTIDAAILGRLYTRISLFEQALGMLDPLLGQAMRLITKEEMKRPQFIAAEDVAKNDPEKIHGMPIHKAWESPNPDDGVETLLAMREKWHRERASEEREWVGPDPGIKEIRNNTLHFGLQIEPIALRKWFANKIENRGGSLYESGDEFFDMIEINHQDAKELRSRCEDPFQTDSQTVHWHDTIAKLSGGPGPYWLTVTFEKEAARSNPERPYITPNHPLVKWLVEKEKETIKETVWLKNNSLPNLPKDGEWLICFDWNIEGLQPKCLRRWLLIDSKGEPQNSHYSHFANLTTQCEEYEVMEEESLFIDNLLDNLHLSLLNEEKRRLHPLLEELRWNARSSWEERIQREQTQISDAQHKAERDEIPVNFRWLRMKQGLIRRLQEELGNRIAELDRLEHDLSGDLSAKIIIKI